MAHVDSHGPKSIIIFNMPIMQTTTTPPTDSDTQLLQETALLLSPGPLSWSFEINIYRAEHCSRWCWTWYAQSTKAVGMRKWFIVFSGTGWEKMMPVLWKKNCLFDRLEKGKKRAREDGVGRRNKVQRHRGIKYVVNLSSECWAQVFLSFSANTFIKHFLGYVTPADGSSHLLCLDFFFFFLILRTLS